MKPRIAKILLAYAVLGCIFGTVMVASPSVAQQSPDPFQALADLGSQEGNTEKQTAQLISILRTEFQYDEELQEFEEESPGFIEDYLTAMRTPLSLFVARGGALARELRIALYREKLSSTEAAHIVNVMRTDQFKELRATMSAISEQASHSLLDGQISENDITQEEVKRHSNEIERSTIATVSADRLSALEEAIEGDPAFAKFLSLGSEILAIKTQIVNLKPTPEEDAALDAAFDTVFERHFPSEE